MSMNDMKTVVTGSGRYNPNHQSRGQNTRTLIGALCPRCGNVFMPQKLTTPPQCPKGCK